MEDKFSLCDTCAYYDYAQDGQSRECVINFDEDEEIRFRTYKKFVCPYYKYYDEYKFVRKQN